MDYDPAELEFIRNDPKYIEQIARCRKNALEAKWRADLYPPKIVDDDLIEFYGSRHDGNNDLKRLSNCFHVRINVRGEVNNSSEHYYQRRKFVVNIDDPALVAWCKERRVPLQTQLDNYSHIRELMATMSSVQVAKYGQTYRRGPIRSDWERVKNSIMWDALVAKFTQNLEFATILKNTNQAVIVERAPTDPYWAVNNHGLGSNELGVMLMAIRNLLE